MRYRTDTTIAITSFPPSLKIMFDTTTSDWSAEFTCALESQRMFNRLRLKCKYLQNDFMKGEVCSYAILGRTSAPES